MSGTFWKAHISGGEGACAVEVWERMAVRLKIVVDAYANMDGSMQKMGRAMYLMAKFRQENRRPA